MLMAEIGKFDDEQAVVTFAGIPILTPMLRGQYSVELHQLFMRFQGYVNDFKVPYNNIRRIFLLPKSGLPHTFVVLTQDPPIPKGPTFYQHIVLQIETHQVVKSNLTLNEELLNTMYEGKLEATYKGHLHKVFTTILCGLSDVEVTRPGRFRSCQNGYAIESSLKAKDGLLYPLEEGFFFLPVPPTLVLYEEIEYVEFMRHGAGGRNMHYFDLLIKLKSGQEHLFCKIQKNEYQYLFDFIRSSTMNSLNLKIHNLNLGEMQTIDGVLQNADNAVGLHLERIRNEVGGDKSDDEVIGQFDDEQAVVTFTGIPILTPMLRGRYSVELHQLFMRFQGYAYVNDFTVPYTNIRRIFLLPKSGLPHTFVVLTHDPPIPKGPTFYQHIVLQFETHQVVKSNLTLNEELLNTMYEGKLEAKYEGHLHKVFTTILCGLSDVEVTRPGRFRSCQNGHAIESSLKAKDGLLYPLEEGFFFLPVPPTLVLYEEIEYVEFMRHGAGGRNMHYFDLLIKLKSGQEHLFCKIQRNEYQNLYDFIRSSTMNSLNLKMHNLNLGEMQTIDGVLQNADNAVGLHLERIRNEVGGDKSDEEDEDYILVEDDGGCPTNNSGGDS